MDDPLYRYGILRLAADATGAGHLPEPDATATLHNPACGDRICVELKVASGKVTALAHATQACILTQASAALLASQAPGLDCAGLQAMAEGVRGFLKGQMAPAGFDVFAGVTEHSGRHTCVLLPLEAALEAMKTLDHPDPGAEGTQPHRVP